MPRSNIYGQGNSPRTFTAHAQAMDVLQLSSTTPHQKERPSVSTKTSISKSNLFYLSHPHAFSLNTVTYYLTKHPPFSHPLHPPINSSGWLTYISPLLMKLLLSYDSSAKVTFRIHQQFLIHKHNLRCPTSALLSSHANIALQATHIAKGAS